MSSNQVVDPTELRRLLEANPGATNPELARALTAHNRERGFPTDVTSRQVAAAISRYRRDWAAEGFEIRGGYHRLLVQRLVEAEGRPIPDKYQNATLTRKLRRLDKVRAGEPEDSDGRMATARRWEAEMLRLHLVVALASDGKPFTRPARAWELGDVIAQRKPE